MIEKLNIKTIEKPEHQTSEAFAKRIEKYIEELSAAEKEKSGRFMPFVIPVSTGHGQITAFIQYLSEIKEPVPAPPISEQLAMFNHFHLNWALNKYHSTVPFTGDDQSKINRKYELRAFIDFLKEQKMIEFTWPEN